ncbi:amidase [Chryseobacterium phosphatilyticum]|uniref:Amidase n=1 Tax=Chryseobacterium phosphatilyticum TaxID=475075 RepID=A0A316XD05_9FLAO|nr:amidase [Chryseobacterium phosphatilyticum]PWN71434.1 amidase [Chryseobacterium phosphatilyticum]
MKKVILSAVLFLGIFTKAQNTSDSQFKYLEYDIEKIQNLYKSNKVTVKEVVEAYLKRINDIDKNGIQLNSVITTNPDAVKIADSLDHLDSKFKNTPLFGIPVLLKDNIDTHDKMPNTAGSLALKNSFPLQDSYLVKKLREAGAVIIGKTNLSEWANFRGEKSTSGWSGLGGLTKNPYILNRNTCGSSAGSGASISSNLGIIAIGTETNGSIICPSSINGIVGLKPTVGLISRQGIIPISFSQDTAGPMARTVKDIAISLGTMVGEDKDDKKTIGNTSFSDTDYTKFLHLNGLKGKRLGYTQDITKGASKKVDDLFLRTLKVLEAQGAVIIKIEKDILSDETQEKSFQLMINEFKDGLNKYFLSLGKNAVIKNIDELIAFNKRNKEELQYFGQEYLELAAKSNGIKDKNYSKNVKIAQEGSRKKGIDLVMDQYKLDAIISPATTEAWKTDLKNGDQYTFGSADAAAIAGYPSITLPMGYIDELPVGILFSARKWEEGKLINMAYTFEQTNPQRKAPKFLTGQ